MTGEHYTDPELEAQYNNVARRPDVGDVLQDWIERSADCRAHADAALDQVYGEHERERIDLFRSGRSDAPLLVYIHGGYWQRGDKSMYSFVAQAFNAAGIDVAVVGYPLCPEVSMSALTDSIRRALAWLYRSAGQLGINRQRINLSGHSAGGHLTAMGLVTDWPLLAGDLPADLLKSGIALSGLFRLQPLLPTSISAALHLTEAEITQLSPVLAPAPATTPTLVVVGGAESEQFFVQADELVRAWSNDMQQIERYDEPGVDHFDLVNRLADPGSELFRRVCARIG
ncbi:MAG: alpha/beta hydrolase [Gammaproteobacteria bacterium]|nr:alpha/beta hydrolase [Gammaproteobacteria bacterium]